MDIRPQSAPPRPPVITRTPLSLRTSELERRSKSSIGDRPSPDSIEEAAAFLFNRVRALISPANDGNEKSSALDAGVLNENLRAESPAGATSSYYGDEGESGDSGSFGSGGKRSPVHAKSGVDFELQQDDNGYQSSDPDFDSVVRIGSVVQKSVASSIVRESNSPLGRPHYSHTSIPADIGNFGLQKRLKHRCLGRMTPSPVASNVGVVGALVEGSSSEDEGNEESTIGGIDPESLRRKIMSRPISEPIKAKDPIIRVVYDDSSSPASCRNSPDLFSRPLHVGSPVKRHPDTPTNTIASPPPLIGITPATDSNSPTSDEAMGDADLGGQSIREGMRTPPPNQSTVGHTGASTPEDGVPGTATVNRGTMTEFDYDEYAEEEYGPPGISVIPSSIGTPPINSSTDSVQGGSKYSTDAFAALSSYDDSDPPIMKRPPPSSLYQEYIRSDLSKGSRTASRARMHTQMGSRSVSRSQMRVEGASEVPVSTQSFTRIITDLEEMLNQALELAGRAVQDSNSALDQRDASVRSLQGSTRGSLISSGFEGTDRAVTAPESLADPDEDNTPDPLILERFPKPPSKLQHDANMSSSTAVYSDNGEHTSRSNLEYAERRKIKNTPPPTLPPLDLAESEKERAWQRNLQDISSDRVSTMARKSYTQNKGFDNTKSSLSSGPEQRFRMEVGRDGEIILVRIPHQKPSTAPGISIPSSGQAEGEQMARRYKGGWEWSLWGKRFAAAVACGVVGLIGWILGSYCAVQTKIEEHLEISPRTASLGNSMFFFSLSIPTLIFWPLPLLHGRKPYLLLSISLLLPLQLPQALSLPPYTTDPNSWNRSMQPYVACLLFFRSVSGIILGFAFMNAMATILDLFGPDTGACCRGGVVYNNRIPLEGQDQYHAVPGGEAGVRMGVWVGIFTWLFVSSPGLGYLFGKITISHTTPAWGFWTIAILAGFLLILIIIAPEVRPPWKKVRLTRRTSRKGPRPAITIAGSEVMEKGELKMVMFGSSPRWWWEEVSAGLLLTWKMMQQYGFLIVAVYFGWVFGHLVVMMMLLASLISIEYKFAPIDIGLAVLAIPIGALLVVPTQLSMFYLNNFRHRSSVTMHNSNYGHEDVGQHPYRRALWIGAIMLPISSVALTISAGGPPTHFMAPVFFAAVMSFSGTLVVAECYLILMENFDISDLPEPFLSPSSGSISQGVNSTGHPHGTQRPASLHHTGDDDSFTTSHPCLSSGFAIFHGLAFLFAAMAVGVSTHIVNGIGVRSGLGVYTTVTCTLTVGLAYALWRNKEVRLSEVFNNDEQERNEKVSMLQRSWGTRWTEVNGMEWWEDENAV